MAKNEKQLRKEAEEENEGKIQSRKLTEKEKVLQDWVPKTELGKKVKQGGFASLDEVFNTNKKILEPEIVDSLTDLEEVVIEIKKTTRVVRAGRKFSFRAAVLVGNKNGLIGLGTAKDTEKWPAVRKATKSAKLNLININRGSGSWEEQPTEARHSVPFKVVGRSGGVHVTLIPAPKGTGLVVGHNIKPVLELAGVQNVWSKARGSTTTKLNFVRATYDALLQTTKMHVSDDVEKKVGK